MNSLTTAHTSLGEIVLQRWLGAGPDGTTYGALDARGTAVEVRCLENLSPAQARRLAHLRLVEHTHVRRVIAAEGDPPHVIVEPTQRSWEDPENWPATVGDLERSFRELARGLAEAHSLGVVHGSLAPADVSRRASGELVLDLTGTRTLDLPNIALAPELGGDAGPTGAADVWALGAILQPVLERIVGDITLPSADPLRALLDAMLSNDPEARPRASKLGEQLAPSQLASAQPSEGSSLPEGIPRRLGAYEIEAEIGAGGMGRVFRARDVATGAAVALKVLAKHAAEDADTVARFQREARILSSLRSPHIARFVEASEAAGRHFLAMELVTGQSARSLLRARGPLPLEEALGIVRCIARALAEVHALGLVHRDVKPANILIEEDSDPEQPRAKLCDFGIARVSVSSDATSLTMDGIPGTPSYMSPEQLTGEPADARSDVYALGVTLFELLVGQPPFIGEAALVMLAHVSEVPPDVRERRPDVPEPIAGILRRTLEKAPEARYADASELLDAIERATRGEAETQGLPQPIDLEGTPIVYEGAWELASSPDELWPHVSNTERLNRAIGLDDVEWTHAPQEGGVLREGTMRSRGMTLRWKENPFEWVAPFRLGVVREYSSGPFEWLRSIVVLTPRPNGGTTLKHTLEIRPRNLLGRIAAGIEVGVRTRRALERVYRRIDAACQRAKDGANGAENDPFETSPGLGGGAASRLERRLERVAAAGGDPFVLEALARFLRSAPAQRVARIRPREWAREHELDPQVVVATFLRAALDGVLVVLWDILCPSCRIPSSMQATLKEISEHGHCDACDLDFELDLARSVELVFRAHSEIRDADVGMYCIGGPAHSPHVLAQVRLAPGQRLALDLALPEGAYRIVARGLASFGFRVHAKAALSGWELALAGGLATDQPRSIRPGAQRIVLTSDVDHEIVARVESATDRADAMTAADAAANTLFRELFPDELLAPEQLVGVSRIALLFAGLGDSVVRHGTDERRAYRDLCALVAKVREVAELEGGALVKMHGDAVVAVFTEPAAAVRTALGLLPAGEIRASVHAGPAMMTNIQDRLDYFGWTVRVGAALVEAGVRGEVLVSDDVARDARVSNILRARTNAAGVVQLGAVFATRVRAA